MNLLRQRNSVTGRRWKAIRTTAVFGIAILLINLCTCSKKGGREVTNDNDATKQKLDQVLQEMIRMADDPAEKSVLAQAKPFGHIKNLDMAVVGLEVPQKDQDRRVHISFTLEYFNEHDVKTLAQEALRDWRSAAAGPAPPPNTRPSI
jgi:hypothetical protein